MNPSINPATIGGSAGSTVSFLVCIMLNNRISPARPPKQVVIAVPIPYVWYVEMQKLRGMTMSPAPSPITLSPQGIVNIMFIPGTAPLASATICFVMKTAIISYTLKPTTRNKAGMKPSDNPMYAAIPESVNERRIVDAIMLVGRR